jgi:hypothetical protein
MAPKRNRRAAPPVEEVAAMPVVQEQEAAVPAHEDVDVTLTEPPRRRKRDREAPRVDSLPAGLDVADLVQKAIAATIASMHLAHQAPPVGDLAAVAEVMGKRYHHLQVLTDSVKTLAAPARNEELWYPHLWFHRVVQDGKSAVTEWRALVKERFRNLPATGITGIQVAGLIRLFEGWLDTMMVLHASQLSPPLILWQQGWGIMEQIMGLYVLSFCGGSAALLKFVSACERMWSRQILEWPEITLVDAKNGAGGERKWGEGKRGKPEISQARLDPAPQSSGQPHLRRWQKLVPLAGNPFLFQKTLLENLLQPTSNPQSTRHHTPHPVLASSLFSTHLTCGPLILPQQHTLSERPLHGHRQALEPPPLLQQGGRAPPRDTLGTRAPHLTKVAIAGLILSPLHREAAELVLPPRKDRRWENNGVQPPCPRMIAQTPSIADFIPPRRKAFQKKSRTRVSIPKPTSDQLLLWETRHAVWRELSKQHQAAGLRFLGVACMSPTDRWDFFLKARGIWSPSTLKSYMEVCLGVRRALDLPVTSHDLKMMKNFKGTYNASHKTWAPPLLPRHVALLRSSILGTTPCPIALAILLAYVHGQRISDVLQLEVDDVVQGQIFTTLYRRRGKVVKTTDAFTTHLSNASLLAAALQQHQFIQRTRGHQFLFSTSNSPEERATLASQTRRRLKLIEKDLELRSVRRGGLMQMAVLGVPLEDIREIFSKHSSTKTLLGYLDAGSVVRKNATTSALVAAQLLPNDSPETC